MAIPNSKFFEGQRPPNVPLFSADNIDWYKEFKLRSFEGLSYKGTRFTGDQWFYYNGFPMLVALKDKDGNPTKNFDVSFPYFSQEDDYLFKQIEEADKSDMGVMLMTGRGYGKTYLVLSIGTKIYYFVKKSHGVISASGKDHAEETWKKFREAINSVNMIHPTIALELLTDNDTELQSGKEVFENNRWVIENRSLMEKIIYDKKPGKSKGRRLNFQHFEEVGDWGGAATLKECIAASEGSWKVGKTKKCREFYTGTGGTVLSDQAKEVFNHPEAYNLYRVTDHANRKTAIYIPAFKKYGGFWEKTGVSDEVGAKAELERIRAEKLTDPDPTAYTKFIQEYPFTIEEMFMKRGGNRFDQKILAKNITYLEENIANRVGEWGDFRWKRNNNEIVGVEWMPSNNGKVWILEHPTVDPEHGVVPPRQYVGGYDGIDLGTEDRASDGGSQGALSIKKRMWPGCGVINNTYVCHYFDSPQIIDTLYDQSLMIMWYFNALTNIEYSKQGIVGHARRVINSLRFFMKRPKLTLDNLETETESNRIGTTATEKNFQYGETFLAQHIKEYGENLRCLPALHDLRDFTMETRGKHDITVSMMMCEIGDDELMDKRVGFYKDVAKVEKEYGYYTDARGNKKWGEIPKKGDHQFNFKSNAILDHVLKNGQGVYINETL